MPLFPQPQKQRSYRRRVNLQHRSWVQLPTTLSDTLYRQLSALCQRLQKQLGRTITLYKGPRRADTLISFARTKNQRAQGFTLTLDAEGITIEAADEPGLYYAAHACVQLLSAGDTKLSATTIEDYPDLAQRAVMIDISRDKVPTMVELKKMIERLGTLRINQLQLYIEHSFAFANHKTVWRDASPLTHGEILELEQHCRDHFIELVPNLNSFGHLERWLKHKEYAHLALRPEGFIDPWGGYRESGSTLKPNRSSIDFIAQLYDEFLPLFNSPLFNVGCDETFELDSTEIYLRHLKKIEREVKKRKRRMMFWGDIILKRPDLIPQLPAGCIALDWGYEANSPFAKTCPLFKQSGVPFYVCPGTSSWNSITGRSKNCLKNLENAAKNGIKHGAEGMIITDWGDHGHHQSLPVSYLGYCAGAAYAWCLKRNKTTDWGTVIDTIFFDDPRAQLGDLWIELGHTIDCAPDSINNNKTFINQLLFSPDDATAAAIVAENRLKKSELRACLRHLQSIKKRSQKTAPRNAETKRASVELELSIDLAAHGLQRGLAHFGATVPSRAELTALKKRYRRHWLQRNRRGGLTDSLARLTL